MDPGDTTLRALGRPAILGQLYDAATHRFINHQAFDAETCQNTESVPSSFTEVQFRDVNTLSDRAQALDISAEMSISIIGGLIELKGSGQYLDTSKSNVSAREVSMICTTRLVHTKLAGDPVITPRAYKRAVQRRATHVVTAITYGGALVANITEKHSVSDSSKRTRGDFSASILKNLKVLFSVNGKASVDSNEIAKEVTDSHDFHVYGDYASSEYPNPISIGDVFELAKKWPELVGNGVPWEVTISPLSFYVDDSIEAVVLHELRTDICSDILLLYDEIFRLAATRTQMKHKLEAGFGQFCPTILSSFRERKHIVDGLLARSRKQLEEYLVGFRKGGVAMAGEVDKFLDDIRTDSEYTKQLTYCEGDKYVLSLLVATDSLAADRQAPFVNLHDLHGLMTQVTSGTLGVILIPPVPNLSSCINTYDFLVANIRRWRADEDKQVLESTGRTMRTVFYSFYCDNLAFNDVLKLDGKKGVLRRALNAVSESAEPHFVHYGELSSNHLQKRYEWWLLNDEGWAFQEREEDSSYYIGQVREGKRHGRGKITYADQSMYQGDWWEDKRHGEGEHVDKGKRTAGVFIDDHHYSDGIIVDLTLIARKVPVKSYKVPLRKNDGTTSHIRRIASMLKWKVDEEYKLSVKCPSALSSPIVVFAIGNLLKPCQDGIYDAAWPLGKGEVDINVERC